jgi:isoprenylcysteine carboxyl methyltransferase (ICMT) family protein YpbQ
MRHPNYLAVLGELLGIALMAQASVAGALSVLVFGALILARIRIEEATLARAQSPARSADPPESRP